MWGVACVAAAVDEFIVVADVIVDVLVDADVVDADDVVVVAAAVVVDGVIAGVDYDVGCGCSCRC